MTVIDAKADIQGTKAHARLPLTLLGLLAPILVLTLIYCRAGRANWFLEVGPALHTRRAQIQLCPAIRAAWPFITSVTNWITALTGSATRTSLR